MEYSWLTKLFVTGSCPPRKSKPSCLMTLPVFSTHLSFYVYDVDAWVEVEKEMPPARLIDSLSRNRKQFRHRLANAASFHPHIRRIRSCISDSRKSTFVCHVAGTDGAGSPLVRRGFTQTLLWLVPGKASPGLTQARTTESGREDFKRGLTQKLGF